MLFFGRPRRGFGVSGFAALAEVAAEDADAIETSAAAVLLRPGPARRGVGFGAGVNSSSASLSSFTWGASGMSSSEDSTTAAVRRVTRRVGRDDMLTFNPMCMRAGKFFIFVYHPMAMATGVGDGRR